MKIIFALFALFVVVASSGCTVPGLNIEIPFLPDIFPNVNVNEQRSDVISIESLDAIPSTTVRAGQSVILRAVVKNLQKPEYKPVDRVDITLFNDCGMFDVSDYFCSDSFSTAHTCQITKMQPQYTAVVQWKLVAKDINVETPCKVGVLAKYHYNTFSTASVTFVNKAELERIVSEGKSASETSSLQIGEGPVKPYVEVLNQPIVVDVERAQNSPKTDLGTGIMTFWIENKGGGYIDMPEASVKDGNSYAGNVKFFDTVDCAPQILASGKQLCIKIGSTPMTSGTAGVVSQPSIKAVNTDKKKEMTLQECMQNHLDFLDSTGKSIGKYSTSFIGKSTPKYSCSFFALEPSRIKEELTYQIMAQIGYDYKFTKETTITVQPKIKL